MEYIDNQEMGAGQPLQTIAAGQTVVAAEEQKPYVLRDLCAKDILPMAVIIRKIGLKDVGKCFDPEEIRSIMDSASDESTDGKKKAIDDLAETVGVGVVLKIVDVILENLPAAEQDIYGFLGGLSELTADAVSNLPMDIFFEMLVDVFRKKEFVGFMKVVSKLLK